MTWRMRVFIQPGASLAMKTPVRMPPGAAIRRARPVTDRDPAMNGRIPNFPELGSQSAERKTSRSVRTLSVLPASGRKAPAPRAARK